MIIVLPFSRESPELCLIILARHTCVCVRESCDWLIELFILRQSVAFVCFFLSKRLVADELFLIICQEVLQLRECSFV